MPIGAYEDKMVTVINNRKQVQKSLSRGTPVDMHQLLEKSRLLSATDSRDRVFALLGMAFNGKQGDKLLTPDYSLTTREVYIKVATHVLETSQTLDVLSQVYHDTHTTRGDNVRGLPSWVPDWSTKPFFAPLVRKFTENGLVPVFQASLDRVSLVPFRFLANELVLCVKGILIDTISTIGTPVFGALAPVFHQWRGMVPEADDVLFLKNQKVREAFWRTILSDQKAEGLILGGNRRRNPRLGSLVDGDIGFPPSNREQEARLKRLRWPLGHRRFFRTECGHIGMAPDLARPNDRIVVLLGGAMAYVLRKDTTNTGTYTYIGDW